MNTRLAAFLLALLVAGASGWAVVRWGTGPKLYAGDTVEVRTCLGCRGSGCRVCGGDGKVDVIIPGPKRPMHVHGDVFETKVRHPGGTSWSMTWVRGPGSRAGDALPGFVPDANVTITGPTTKPLRLVADRHGRFHVKLLPGTYQVTTTAPGFVTLAKALDVASDGPIWLEEKPLDGNALYQAREAGVLRGEGESALNIGLERAP